MNTLMHINILQLLVLSTTGAVDQKATLKKVREEADGLLTAYAKEHDPAVTNFALEAELDAIYDSSKEGEAIQAMTLAVKIGVLRGANLEKELAGIKEEIQEFVSKHPRFKSAKGRTGGVHRLSAPVTDTLTQVSEEPEVTVEVTEDQPILETSSEDTTDASASDASASEETEESPKRARRRNRGTATVEAAAE